jgi:hypothetical protein
MERAIEEGIDFVGGKKDGMSVASLSRDKLIGVDITVIVGVVGERGL